MPCSISGSPWKTFFEAHWDTLAALDFFNIDVLTFAGIFRYHVLFVIRLKTLRGADRWHCGLTVWNMDEADALSGLAI